MKKEFVMVYMVAQGTEGQRDRERGIEGQRKRESEREREREGGGKRQSRIHGSEDVSFWLHV